MLRSFRCACGSESIAGFMLRFVEACGVHLLHSDNDVGSWLKCDRRHLFTMSPLQFSYVVHVLPVKRREFVPWSNEEKRLFGWSSMSMTSSRGPSACRMKLVTSARCNAGPIGCPLSIVQCNKGFSAVQWVQDPTRPHPEQILEYRA